jgi:hypothetical protein
MPYLIHAHDGSVHVVLKRDFEEAALKKAAELKHLGWIKVEVTREAGQKRPRLFERSVLPLPEM